VKKFSLLFLFLLLPTLFIYSQEASSTPPTEEDDPFFWDYEIGGSQVDLFLEGYWDFDFSTGIAASWDQGELIFPSFYPGMTSYWKIDQTPDLLLSLWLDNQFYIESSFVKDYEKNTYAMGYQSMDDPFIKHIRLANSNLETQGYGGLQFASPLYNTPGLLIEAESNQSQHELLLRLDGSQEEEWVYQGNYLIEEDFKELHLWASSLFFVLPHQQIDPNSLSVYLQDSRGSFSGSDGFYYRKLEPGEYQADLDQGLLSFSDIPSGRILVFYSKGVSLTQINTQELWIPTLSSTGNYLNLETPILFDWNTTDPFDPTGETFLESSTVDLDGQICLLLKRPGHFSPFEYANSYELSFTAPEEQWKRGVQLVNKDSLASDEGRDFTSFWDSTFVHIYTSTSGMRSLESRYPLWEDYPEIYGPTTYNKANGQSSLLRFYKLSGEGSIKLPDSMIDGSLSVSINGRESTSYRIDDSDNLLFNRYVLPSDRIVIRFRRENPTYQGGELLFYQGNRFQFSENHFADLSTRLLWTLPEGASEQQEGMVSLSAYHSFESEYLQSKLKLAGHLRNPDTRGWLRLAGMEKNKEEVPVYPAALQSAFNDYASFDSINLPQLSQSDFVLMDEYDFTTDQNELLDYDSPFYNETGNSGPSAAGGKEIHTPVVVLPYQLSMGEWTGATLMLSPKGEPFNDLSSLEQLSFRLKLEESSEPPDQLYLLMGETGEMEDHNGDNQLDNPSPGHYIVLDLNSIAGLPVAGGSWLKYTIDLDDTQRLRLENCPSLTLILDHTSATATSSGQMEWGDIQLLGRGFNLDPGNSGGLMKALEIEDTSLLSQYKETESLFHPEGEDQRASRIEWSAMELSDQWDAELHLNQSLVDNYRYLHFYIKPEYIALGSTINFIFENNQGEGLKLQYQPQSPTDTNWTKISVDLINGALLTPVDGLTIQSIDNLDSMPWSKMRVTGTGSTDGIILIDEIYQSESLYEQTAEARWELYYTPPFTVETTSGFSILNNLSVESVVTGNQYTQLNGRNDMNVSFNHSLDTGLNLVIMGIQGNLNYSLKQSLASIEGGHQLQLPYFNFPVKYKEVFHKNRAEEDLKYSEEREIALGIPVLQSSLTQSLQRSSQKVEQQWALNNQWTGNPVIKVNLLANASLNAAIEESSPEEYMNQWTESWQWIIPESQNHQVRDSSLHPSILLNMEDFKIQGQWDFNTAGGFAAQWHQEAAYSSYLEFPVNLSDQLMITGYYTRNKEWKQPKESNNTYLMDWYFLGENLKNHFPLWSELPFLELFQIDYIPAFQNQNESLEEIYTVTFGTSLERHMNSDISDLFLPIGITADFNRSFRKKGTEFQSSNVWDFSIIHEANNILGDFGTNPLFHFYLTDSYYSSWDLSMKAMNHQPLAPAELQWDLSVEFKAQRESRLSLNNQMNWNWSDQAYNNTSVIAFTRRTASQDYFKVPLADRIIDRPFYAEQKSKAHYSIGFPLDNSETIKEYQVDLSYHWILHFSEWATVDNWVALGYKNAGHFQQTGSEIGTKIHVEF